MKIKKYWPLLVVVAAVLLLMAGKMIADSNNQSANQSSGEASSSEVILFYGDTCPHCKNVDEYLNTNKVRERFSFQELEVYNNAANAAKLTKTAKDCGWDTKQGVGVPFLFDGQNCLMGDRDIITYFQNK